MEAEIYLLTGMSIRKEVTCVPNLVIYNRKLLMITSGNSLMNVYRTMYLQH
jgi:hypothetical protein